MEDNFCCWKNGREPQFVKKISGKMEDDLNLLAKWKTTTFFCKLEDYINFKGKRRQPQFRVNGRLPKFQGK